METDTDHKRGITPAASYEAPVDTPNMVDALRGGSKLVEVGSPLLRAHYTFRIDGSMFCVQCKIGGLKRESFRSGGTHFNHPSIKVYNTKQVLTVLESDMGKDNFMTADELAQIQVYTKHGARHFKLRSILSTGTRCSLQNSNNFCHFCGTFIPSPLSKDNVNSSPHRVCSVECLVKYSKIMHKWIWFLVRAVERYGEMPVVAEVGVLEELQNLDGEIKA